MMPGKNLFAVPILLSALISACGGSESGDDAGPLNAKAAAATHATPESQAEVDIDLKAGDEKDLKHSRRSGGGENRSFKRIASFPVCSQIGSSCDSNQQTAAEIVAASTDGKTLIYSNSPLNTLGFVDMLIRLHPVAKGSLPMGGEPTSVAVRRHLSSGKIVEHFSAGAVNLERIDRTDDRPASIALTDSLQGVLREPDGVAWLPRKRFATADEGDLDGGSRGFTVFNMDGTVAFTSGNLLEHEAVRLGHYPHRRSDAKGNEPENVAFARFHKDEYLFVASERSNLVFVSIFLIRHSPASNRPCLRVSVRKVLCLSHRGTCSSPRVRRTRAKTSSAPSSTYTL
jgi:hypothetical protein